MNKPFDVGDKVKKWKIWQEEMANGIWTVDAIREAVSQSGYVCDVSMEGTDRKMFGWDLDWYIKV